ncbi:MAG: ribonuclease H-like domain-containing protein [Candidatus Aminicenantia bacterium]
MDIKEKLRVLRKKRNSIQKDKKIEDYWQQVSQEKNLSIKQKLEKLVQIRTDKLTSKKNKQIFFEKESQEKISFYEHPFPLSYVYGKVPLKLGLEISGDILYCLSNEPEFEHLDLSSSLFLDLETTGLSGGTGIVPFLVGLGFYQEDHFYIIQYFLGELSEEEELINQLSQFLQEMDFKSIITYHGKGFDIPILETRFILNRQPFYLTSLPHLDFLYPARSLWRHKYESCKLSHLAKWLVQAEREDDIPPEEIPWRYFNYLRTGDLSLIEPILYHNEQDILSLLSLVILGAMFFTKEKDLWIGDGADLFGAGKVFERMGNWEGCINYYQKALEQGIPDELALTAKKKLSYFYKKKQNWSEAISLWYDLASSNQMFSFRELAMYYEHREKNFKKAREIVERGLKQSNELPVCRTGRSIYYQEDFEYRLKRLQRKISKK